MYKLSVQLSGHKNDVRSLTITESDTIISSSRDGTVRSWDLSGSFPQSTTVLNSSSGSFINATTYLGDGLIASGGKDCIIFINSIEDKEVDVGTISNLIGHQNNICSLNCNGHHLVSSSWDGSAKVWDLSTFTMIQSLDLGMSVLDAVLLSDGKVLTASADKSIKLWDGKSVTKTFSGHTDVVRKLLILDDDTFASTSNDGTIKVWNLSQSSPIHVLTGHESFIYDLIQLPNGLLVSSGEDRSVRIWKDFKISQTITLPCISNWCLTNRGNDIVVGSSDHLIRIFTSDSSKYASSEELEEFDSKVSNSTIAEQSVDLNKTDVPGPERLNSPGKEGQTVMVKTEVGTIEAHQWSNNKWNKIGDVVSASTSGSKKSYQGKEYDYLFDVDIEDGKPPLKLPYNVNDNLYSVAEKFLADNELPASYLQEVVNFLQKSTEAKNITETSATPDKPISRKPLVILPVKEPILFKDINNDSLIKGLTKFNQTNGGEIAVIPSNFDVGSAESLSIINNIIKTVFGWNESSFVIGFDILRVLILKISISDILQDPGVPELLLGFINKGMASDNVTTNMMMLKFLCNFTTSVGFIQTYLDQEGSKIFFNEFLIDLLAKLSSKSIDLNHKHAEQYLISLSTFIYDVSVIQLQRNISNTELSEFFNNGPLTTKSESFYRVLIAYGNLKTVIKLPKWEFQVPNESRFDSLVEELNSLQ